MCHKERKMGTMVETIQAVNPALTTHSSYLEKVKKTCQPLSSCFRKYKGVFCGGGGGGGCLTGWSWLGGGGAPLPKTFLLIDMFVYPRIHPHVYARTHVRRIHDDTFATYTRIRCVYVHVSACIYKWHNQSRLPRPCITTTWDCRPAVAPPPPIPRLGNAQKHVLEVNGPVLSGYLSRQRVHCG